MYVSRTDNICNSTCNAYSVDFRPLTVDDYHVLIEAGRLNDHRIELLNGVLIKKGSQSPEYVSTTSFLFKTFYDGVKDRAFVRQAAPITLSESNSEPEPDIILASGVPTDYKYRHPAADEILLVVEVSDCTLRKDIIEKLELYTSENIPEYWILDVKGSNVRVLRHPKGKCYLHDQTFCVGDIASAAFPDAPVNVEKLF